MKKYKNELNQIAMAGVAVRNDWKYKILEGNVSAHRYKDRVIKYDKRGRTIEKVMFDEQGIRQSIVVFIYDSIHLPQSDVEFTPLGELIGKTYYTYSEAGQLSEITSYNSFEYIISKKIYEIDWQNNTVIERVLFSPDSVNQKTIFYYSNLNNGLINEEWIYIGENNLDYKKVIHRNEDNKIDSEIYTTKQGNTMYYLRYNYDQKDNLVQIERHMPSGIKTRVFDFNYTSSGLLSGEIKYNEKGEIIHYYKYTYE